MRLSLAAVLKSAAKAESPAAVGVTCATQAKHPRLTVSEALVLDAFGLDEAVRHVELLLE